MSDGDPEHLQILQRGVEAWNAWRDQHKDIRPDLREGRSSLDATSVGPTSAGLTSARPSSTRSPI